LLLLWLVHEVGWEDAARVRGRHSRSRGRRGRRKRAPVLGWQLCSELGELVCCSDIASAGGSRRGWRAGAA